MEWNIISLPFTYPQSVKKLLTEVLILNTTKRGFLEEILKGLWMNMTMRMD